MVLWCLAAFQMKYIDFVLEFFFFGICLHLGCGQLPLCVEHSVTSRWAGKEWQRHLHIREGQKIKNQSCLGLEN